MRTSRAISDIQGFDNAARAKVILLTFASSSLPSLSPLVARLRIYKRLEARGIRGFAFACIRTNLALALHRKGRQYTRESKDRRRVKSSRTCSKLKSAALMLIKIIIILRELTWKVLYTSDRFKHLACCGAPKSVNVLLRKAEIILFSLKWSQLFDYRFA
jgi:hypothetical protein